MNHTCTQRLSGQYFGIARRFVPPALQHDVALTARATNVVNAAVCAGIAGPFYALACWLLGLRTAGLEILLCSAMMLAAPLVLRLSGSVVAAREVFLCALFFNFSWLSWHLGGIVAPTVSWLIAGPMVAMFLGGKRCAGAWLALSCVSAGLIYGLQAHGVAQPVTPRADLALLHLICELGLYIVVLVFALLFEQTRNEGFARLRQALAPLATGQGGHGGHGGQHDQLTGLLNRRLLRDRLRHAMERADRNRRPLALMLFNINRFKEVNDALGYEAGDAVLTQAGNAIRRCLRDCDTVARWGGDEFVALLEDLGAPGDAQLVAEKVLDCFITPLAVDGRDCHVTLALGIALYPAPDCNVDALLKRADIAMRSAKSPGRNSVRQYAGQASTDGCGVLQPLSERLAIKSGLQDALTQGQLFIEYQPQVELRERRVTGVEALLRWQHPVYGRIDPGRFIALAEETGIIVPIGEWVLRRACLQHRAWCAAGLPQIKTAVNLSARQLKEPGMAAQVLAILAETGMPPACLELEITEGILIEDLGANCATIDILRRAGVLVSIDDFGTGYSSLNYLCELPVDILKLDGQFVRRLGVAGRDGRVYAVADSIVAMAHRLGLSVIAEAVETGEQLGDLCAMGCDAAQGYLFDRPLAPEKVAALLAREARELAASAAEATGARLAAPLLLPFAAPSALSALAALAALATSSSTCPGARREQ